MSRHNLTDSELATIINALLIAAEECARDAKKLEPFGTAVGAASLESSKKYAALADRIDSGATEVDES